MNAQNKFIIHTCEQGSVDWFYLRLGKVTGTTLKDVMKTDNLPLMDDLIGQILSEQIDDDDYVSPEMQRGIDLEPQALEQYEKETGLKMERVGFIQSQVFSRFGMSPDGILINVGGVEVKCPSSKKHVQYMRQNQLPNDYKWQVIAPFIINPDLQWWDFVSYDPRISQRPLFIIRTKRQDVVDDIDLAQIRLKKFFTKLDEYMKEILFPTDAEIEA